MDKDLKKLQQREILMRDVVQRQEDLISELFRQSSEKGDLDNLPGKGKPLQLDDDSEAAPEDRMVNRFMKSNNILPKWVELSKQIEAETDELKLIKEPSALDEKRRQINKKIDDYNLLCPPSLQKRRLSP
jgi:hypothetical protein